MKKYLRFLTAVVDPEMKFVFRGGSAYEVTWDDELQYKIRDRYVFTKRDEGHIFEIIEK